jgi:uncharacterized caspase-like protein
MSMLEKKKALLIGNNSYQFTRVLKGCHDDASKMKKVLQTHGKGDPNFSVLAYEDLNNETIQKEIKSLLERKAMYALLYFSGHGRVVEGEGFICGVDTKIESNYGVSMYWLSDQINQSKIPEVTVILDCCHAGVFGNSEDKEGQNVAMELSTLRKGVTVLAATTSDDVAAEFGGKGIFTSLLYDGLQGAAADILGHVNPVGLYYCAESILNPWQQRPVFKTFVDQMTPIRYCIPAVDKKITRQVDDITYFSSKDTEIKLSPSIFQGEDKERDKVMRLSFFEKSGLLECPEGKTLYQAILDGDSCRLSPYGKYVWELARRKMI